MMDIKDVLAFAAISAFFFAFNIWAPVIASALAH